MAKTKRASRRHPTRENPRDTYAVMRRGEAAGAELAARVQGIADAYSRKVGVRVLKTMNVPAEGGR